MLRDRVEAALQVWSCLAVDLPPTVAVGFENPGVDPQRGSAVDGCNPGDPLMVETDLVVDDPGAPTFDSGSTSLNAVPVFGFAEVDHLEAGMCFLVKPGRGRRWGIE